MSGCLGPVLSVSFPFAWVSPSWSQELPVGPRSPFLAPSAPPPPVLSHGSVPCRLSPLVPNTSQSLQSLISPSLTDSCLSPVLPSPAPVALGPISVHYDAPKFLPSSSRCSPVPPHFPHSLFVHPTPCPVAPISPQSIP